MAPDPRHPEPSGSGREPARGRAGLVGGEETGQVVRISTPPVPPRPPLPPRPPASARPAPVEGPGTVGLHWDDDSRHDDAGHDDADRDDAGHDHAPDTGSGRHAAEPPLTAVPDALGAEAS